MPLLRHEPGNENKSAGAAYVFQEAEGGGGGIVDANIALPFPAGDLTFEIYKDH